MTEKEIRNCRIIVKDAENDQTIADTRVLGFNSYVNSVNIPAGSIMRRDVSQVYAIIFTKELLYKFNGRFRNEAAEDEMEILLGKSDVLEERRATRYSIGFEGYMTAVYIDGRKTLLPKRIPVQTIDMSANGVLLKADAGRFKIGEIYSLTLRTEAGILSMRCEIVRIQEDDPLFERYGCRIDNVQRE